MVWVFDNDGTLYHDNDAGIQFSKLFEIYARREFGIQPENQGGWIEELKKKYNTDFSVVTLMQEYGIDYADFIQKTYLKIDLSQCIGDEQAQGIAAVLGCIDGEKVVMTNNPSDYARYVLEYLGISSEFSSIIGMEEMDFTLKPQKASFETVEKLCGFPSNISFVDDRLENVVAAQRFGWASYWLIQVEDLNYDVRQISSLSELCN